MTINLIKKLFWLNVIVLELIFHLTLDEEVHNTFMLHQVDQIGLFTYQNIAPHLLRFQIQVLVVGALNTMISVLFQEIRNFKIQKFSNMISLQVLRKKKRRNQLNNVNWMINSQKMKIMKAFHIG